MKRTLQIILLILSLSPNVYAEETADTRLLELMGLLEPTRYASGRKANYQIINACLYTVYHDWERGYVEVLKKTPLDSSKMTTLNIYSEFAASIKRDMHVLNALYPSLFSNISHYIKSRRAEKLWPEGPAQMSIKEIYLPLLTENLEACFASEIGTELSNTILEADYRSGAKALDETVQTTFVRSEPGIDLVTRINSDIKSDIPGIETGVGQDDFITTIPPKN